MAERKIALIVHNVRSCHNVGSLLRTADGLGIDKLFLTGYTPYPKKPGDKRLPHEIANVAAKINKTALGADESVNWQYWNSISRLTLKLKSEQYVIAALEQTSAAVNIVNFQAPAKIALLVGSETGGLDPATLKLAQQHLFIPMLGAKESFNVSVAAAMALFHLKYPNHK